MTRCARRRAADRDVVLGAHTLVVTELQMAKRTVPVIPPERDCVLVDGARTPFLRSNGAYKDLMAHDLGRFAVTGLLAKTGLDPAAIDQVIFGNVVQDPRTTNVAREVSLGAGIPVTTPAFTTTLACISSNVAATSAADAIRLGHYDVAVVGGAETFSDPPIRLSKNLRQALVKLQRVKGAAGYLDVLKDLSPEDLLPDVPSPAEFSTGLTMGQSCERFARRIGVSREEADAFAVRSHVLADRAWKEGRYADEVVPVALPPSFDVIERDDGPRGDSTLESLARLKPAFDKEYGTITAASSSFLSDGASAVLLTSRARAAELGKKPRSVIRDFVYAASDPLEDLLAGPYLTIPKLLSKNGLLPSDIGVWEIHEAFASQVLACLKLLERELLIEIPLEQLNPWGGSLSLGHPFGATGGRLLTTATHRLEVTGARYAIVAGCAAGGHGSAVLLEAP